MLKKSKVVALLAVCVMMFAVVEPACAERSWEDVGNDVSYGATGGAIWGAIIGGIGGFLVGGPAGAWAGAEAGAWIGGGTGAVAGAAIDTGRTDAERKEFRENMENLHDSLEYMNQHPMQ